jgi:hypothetical protein
MGLGKAIGAIGKAINNKPELIEIIESSTMVEDATAWMVNSEYGKFLLLATNEIKYMCMLAYAFMAAKKVFSSPSASTASPAYKFVSCILATTGGGTLVPIFLNGIPVAMAQDAYMIAILLAYCLHEYFPILKDVVDLSPYFKVPLVAMFEIQRAYVVCTLTKVAAIQITPSQFSFAIFGPIMCGAVGGCGAAFFPLSLGYTPIHSGLTPPMMTALIAAAAYHLFVSTSLSDGCIDAAKKAQFHVAIFFVASGVITAYGLQAKQKAIKEETEKKTN